MNYLRYINPPQMWCVPRRAKPPLKMIGPHVWRKPIIQLLNLKPHFHELTVLFCFFIPGGLYMLLGRDIYPSFKYIHLINNILLEFYMRSVFPQNLLLSSYNNKYHIIVHIIVSTRLFQGKVQYFIPFWILNTQNRVGIFRPSICWDWLH